jgi:two-component system cell cycle sensor histidine kinase PleC
MSKIEAGKYTLDYDMLNLSKAIDLAVHMMSGRATEAGLTLDLHKNMRTENLYGDRRAIMQIMLNLLSNAIKFTNAGGKITLSCEETHDHQIIRVHDTGIGIPIQKLSLVTKPFEQAASSQTRGHQGSGLGLAITKELIELHGGSLHIDSVVGEGTIVTVRLPKVQIPTILDSEDE